MAMSSHIMDLNRIVSLNFSPRAVVLASPKVKLACGSNYLTPAEFLTAFGYIKESYITNNLKGQDMKSLNLRFIDFEEFNFVSKETYRNDIADTLNSNKPDLEMLKNIRLDLNSPQSQRLLLNDLSWTPFCNIWRQITSAAVSEEDQKQHIRKGIILITMVSTSDGDIAEAINDLVTANINRLADIFNEKNSDIERKVFRVNMIVEDRQNSNKALNEDEKKIMVNHVRQNYPQSFTRIVTMNRKAPEDPPVASWSQYVYRKNVIKSFEVSDFEKVGANEFQPNRGRYISAECMANFREFFREFATEYLFERLQSRIVSLRTIAEDKKRQVKTVFFGLFKKEEEAVFIDGKYVFTHIEEAAKVLADFSFTLGFFESAEKEYKYLYTCVKVIWMR